MSVSRRAGRAGRAAVAVGLLGPLAAVTSRVAWWEAQRLWRHHDSLLLDDLVLACALAALAATVGWLSLAVAVTVVSLGRGRIARRADTWSRRVAPAVVRGALGATCGAVALTTVAPAATPAMAVSVIPYAGRCTSSLDASSSPVHRLPAPDRPTAADRVVVRRGETLWSIARRDLPDASDAAVARAWPRWFAANRRVIGPDPDLIRTGTLLRRPDPPPTRQGRR